MLESGPREDCWQCYFLVVRWIKCKTLVWYEQRNQPTKAKSKICVVSVLCFFILFLPIWVSFIGPCFCLCVCVCMCLRVCVGSCAFSQSVLCSVFLSAHEPGAWRDLLGTGVNELCLRKSQIQNVCEHNCTQSHTSLLVFHPVKEQSILPLRSGKNQRGYFLTLFRCPSISMSWTGLGTLPFVGVINWNLHVLSSHYISSILPR